MKQHGCIRQITACLCVPFLQACEWPISIDENFSVRRYISETFTQCLEIESMKFWIGRVGKSTKLDPSEA
jgi:hypothetical protein